MERRLAQRLPPIAAGVAGVLGVLWLVLVAAPPWFVHDGSLDGLKAQNDVRTTLLQGLGGVVLLVGAYFTYRQLHTAQQGQITERFTRAIDQLGHAQLDVRLGGIYALERIARDSTADRATIGEVLTAFVRSHAPWPPHLPGQYRATAPFDQVPELQVRTADVQACLTVLGRGGFASPPAAQGERLDLHAVDLRRATLRDAHLEGARLVGAHLEGANLRGAHLERADLYYAHLRRANLDGADLEGAFLDGADLEGARLDGADLEGARLVGAHLEDAGLADTNLEQANLGGAHLEGASVRRAHLEGANLDGAHLEEADLPTADLKEAHLEGAHLEGANLEGAHLERAYLSGANLEEAILEGADLEGARANERTSWPVGFDWRAAGVVVAGEDTAASGS